MNHLLKIIDVREVMGKGMLKHIYFPLENELPKLLSALPYMFFFNL
jgi:hypothetical protein